MVPDVAEVHKLQEVTPVGVVSVRGLARNRRPGWSGIGSGNQGTPASGRPEESPEVCVFPSQRGTVEPKLPFFLPESRRVERASAVGELPDADGGMKHFVVNDVVHEESRHERTIERRAVSYTHLRAHETPEHL